MDKIAPLSGGFMVVSIAGFFFSLLKVYTVSKSLGAAFMLVFIIMFISSLISMTYAPTKALLQMENRK